MSSLFSEKKKKNKNKKKNFKISSAAVVIGALKVKVYGHSILILVPLF